METRAAKPQAPFPDPTRRLAPLALRKRLTLAVGRHQVAAKKRFFNTHLESIILNKLGTRVKTKRTSYGKPHVSHTQPVKILVKDLSRARWAQQIYQYS